MNRLGDDYDPYAVEEPSDEEPALSRWAPAPPRPSRLRALASSGLVRAGPVQTLGPAVPAPVAPRCRLWDAKGNSGEVLATTGEAGPTTAQERGAILESRVSLQKH